MPISQYHVLTRPCHTDCSDYPQETENVKRVKSRVEEPSPSGYIYSTTPVAEFHGSLQKREWEECKSQRNGVCWETVSPKMSKLTLIKSQQDGCLNETWIQREESSGSLNLHKEPLGSNECWVWERSLLCRSAHQLHTHYQGVSTENTYASNTGNVAIIAALKL